MNTASVFSAAGFVSWRLGSSGAQLLGAGDSKAVAGSALRLVVSPPASGTSGTDGRLRRRRRAAPPVVCAKKILLKIH